MGPLEWYCIGFATPILVVVILAGLDWLACSGFFDKKPSKDAGKLTLSEARRITREFPAPQYETTILRRNKKGNITSVKTKKVGTKRRQGRSS